MEYSPQLHYLLIDASLPYLLHMSLDVTLVVDATFVVRKCGHREQFPDYQVRLQCFQMEIPVLDSAQNCTPPSQVTYNLSH